MTQYNPSKYFELFPGGYVENPHKVVNVNIIDLVTIWDHAVRGETTFCLRGQYTHRNNLVVMDDGRGSLQLSDRANDLFQRLTYQVGGYVTLTMSDVKSIVEMGQRGQAFGFGS